MNTSEIKADPPAKVQAWSVDSGEITLIPYEGCTIVEMLREIEALILNRHGMVRPYQRYLMDNRVKAAVLADGQREYSVNYSAHPDDANGEPIDNLDEVAGPGRVILVYQRMPFFGNGEDYCSEVLENPTWLKVCVEANRAIHCTGDHHHTFLEGLNKKCVEDGVTIYQLMMGS